MELLEKSFNYFSKKTGLIFISGRVYTRNAFVQECSKLFPTEIQEQYAGLVQQYDHKEDRRKGIENQTLFIEMAYRLGLNKSPKSLNILDIGSRGGLFPFVCNSYGHHAVATDMREVQVKSPNAEMLDFFGVERNPLKVSAFEPIIGVGGPYDLITGFRTRFHSRYTWETGKNCEEHWGISEWGFFLKDLANNLTTEHARIFFMINRLQEREKGKIIPRSLREYFIEKGANIQYSYLSFDDLSRLRQ